MRLLITIAAVWVAAVTAGEPMLDLRAEIHELRALHGVDYVRRRNSLIEKDGVRGSLTKIGASTDTAESILLSALAYRLRSPESAAIVDGYLSASKFGPHDLCSKDDLTGERTSVANYRVVVACIGIDAFPVIAESIVFSTGVEPTAAMRALALTHNVDAVDVFLLIARDVARPAVVRAAAIYNLGLLMESCEAQTLVVNPSAVGPRRVPEELRTKVAARQLPEVEIPTERKMELYSYITACLDAENPEQVRSVSASALRRYKDAVPILIDKLKNDASGWVRAWCASSLQFIGGDQAERAIKGVLEIEKNREVRLVLEGKGTPAPPWLGVPTDSILLRE